MQVPGPEQIVKMTPDERADLVGWLRTEHRAATQVRNRAKNRRDEARGRLDAAEGEFREAEARLALLGEAIGVARTLSNDVASILAPAAPPAQP